MEFNEQTEQEDDQEQEQEQEQEEEDHVEGPADKLVPISPVTIPTMQQRQAVADDFFQDESEF